MRRPRRRAPQQLLLPVPNTWGGRRRGAGRPVHVTLRARREVGSLRSPRAFGAVQRDHVHLLVEAHSREVLIRGVQGLEVRLARAANRALRRRGRVFADRYHARALRTPREVRHALIYVLRNIRKHHPAFRGVDPWLDEARPYRGRRGAAGRLAEPGARRDASTLLGAWYTISA